MSSIPPDMEPRAAQSSASSLVLRNTLFLSVAQLASLPLSILLNASMARYLGATALGYMYLGSTFNAFAYLIVEWGQAGALPAMVASDRSRAGALLGTSLAWRFPLGLISGLVIYAACTLLGYEDDARTAICVFSIAFLATTLVNVCQETILGFERTDVTAVRQFSEQLLAVLFVIPVMLLGGKMPLALLACAAATLVAGVYVWRSLARVGVGRVRFDRKLLSELLARGAPFVVLNLAMILQPNVDAVFLSKYASPEAVGWHAAARKLMGLLLFPATTMVGALYPTLCRLFATQREQFEQTAAAALRGTALLVMPVALSCGLYPELGLVIYGRDAFGPAADNLRVFAVFIFLVYFTMPIGVSLLAMGKQRSWAVVQSLCVLVSAVLDPLLVPWFQAHAGNGGLGVATAGVVSELLVIGCGVALAPRGLFGRDFWRSLRPALGSGAVMALSAYLLRGLNGFVAAPMALTAYVIALRVTGGLDDATLELASDFVRRKLGRLMRKPAAQGGR